MNRVPDPATPERPTAGPSHERPRELPNLTVQQFEYLVAAVDHTTHAEAASSLGVSPSALSQGLSELGRRLDIALFERTGRGARLTAEAGPVLDHARMVLARTAELATYSDDVRHGRQGRVRAGMIDVAAVHHFAPVLHQVRAAMPDIDLRLTVAPSTQLIDRLSAAELDIAVVVRPANEPSDTEMVDLVDEPLHVYVGRSVPPPVAADSTAEVADPSDPSTWGPWVGFPAGSHTRRIIARALEAAGASYDVVAESHQPEVLKEMTALGIGWVVLPPAQAETEPRPLRRVTDEAITHRTLTLIRRAGTELNPAAEEVSRRLVELH